MVKLRRLAVALLVLAGLAVPALAAPPVPPLTGRVVDLAQVLDAGTEQALDRRLADHEAATTDQIVVVTLPGLEGYTIEQWGYALLNGWGIGQRGKNNGVVLVVAPNDRRLRIEVGYGLEYALTEQAATGIIEREIIPRFKREDLAGGVSAGVDAIIRTIAGTYQPPQIEAPSGGVTADRSIMRYAPFVIFPLFFVIIVLFKLRRGGLANRRGYYDGPRYGSARRGREYDGWGSRSGGFSGGRSSGGGFSGGGGRGGGGRGGGGGASGRW